MINILLVEDNPLERLMVQKFLKEEDFSFIEASDGLEALGHLSCHKFDIMITDNQMPNMTGAELCPIVREKYPDLPIIGRTFTSPGSMDVDDYIPKDLVGNKEEWNKVKLSIRKWVGKNK